MPDAAGKSRRRVLLIGLDSASPAFLFERCLPVMPSLKRLLGQSARSTLITAEPPISLPAWAVLGTGVDPGTLGIYGFRHRRDHSYTETYAPSSDNLPVPTVWELFSKAGLRVCLIGMPPAYPPPPLNGISISDFLTPAGAVQWTHPVELAKELESKYGPYPFDVTFRAEERDQLFRDIVRMTETRFRIAEDLYAREPWDVFTIHEVGVDRFHHAYTKYFDPAHSGYVPGNPYEKTLLEYYAALDRAMGKLIARADSETDVIIASDHGSMPMIGCFCINQWLAEKGFLSVHGSVGAGTPLEKAPVDWSKTQVWGAGGYYARIFFNRKGREAQGLLDERAVGETRGRLLSELAKIRLPEGRNLRVDVREPSRLYREVRGDPPDLMIYLEDLKWRSSGTLGHPSLFLRENDTGPDDAVHSFEGILVYQFADDRRERVMPDQKIIDIAPTLLERMGLPIPPHVQGQPIRG